MSWQKRTAAIIGIVFGVIIVLGVAAYFVIRSSAFHRFVIAKVEQAAAKSTGGQLQIGNYSAHFSPLGVTLYDVVLHGSEPADSAPFLQADSLAVGLKVVSILHHKVDLNSLELTHPVVHLLVNKEGQSNFPKSQQPSSGSTNVFDLGVDHALISNGEIYYNNESTPLDADLHDLQARAQYQTAQASYDGSISYDRGTLKFGTYDPLPHNLRAHFSASRSSLKLDSLV